MRIKGKGRLTDKNTKKLTKYYGKAIRSNIGDSAAIKDALWAVFYHSQSTDSMPQHQFVPVGSSLGASIIVHLLRKSHLHPTQPPSIQTVPLICSRSLSSSPRTA